MKVGYIALVGRPNVGKSTLLNRLIGQKISITSRKPQTTRHSIIGIHTTDDFQHIYVDTPGIHSGEKKALNRYLNRTASSVLAGVDVVVWLVDAQGLRDEDQLLYDKLGSVDVPVILVVNKIDKLSSREACLPLLEQVNTRFRIDEIVPLSAAKGDNVELLIERITRLLPDGIPVFPPDQVSDRPERFLAAEIVREKLIRQLGQELPYAIAVEVEQFKDEERLTRISMLIWVERASQKAIVIGENGANLKAVGQAARLDLEKMLDRKVFLQLWVKVKSGWSDNERALQGLGYQD